MFKLGGTAILLTCFNRREKTYKCLVSLFEILHNCDVYLVDDSSTDGTSEMIRDLFPQVNLIQGTGNLFWNRGMNLAWTNAVKGDYDFYIWINDDVVLYKDAISELLRSSQELNHRAIISGIIEDERQVEVIYGGTDERKNLVRPSGLMLPIHHMNGNVVLVPKYVYQKLGNLDIRFHHDLGDVDYGLRALKNGIQVFSTSKPIASGCKNPISRLRENGVSLVKRFKKLYSPLGSNPNTNFYFRKRHYGVIHASIFFLFQHFLVLIPDSLNTLLFKSKYQ